MALGVTTASTTLRPLALLHRGTTHRLSVAPPPRPSALFPVGGFSTATYRSPPPLRRRTAAVIGGLAPATDPLDRAEGTAAVGGGLSAPWTLPTASTAAWLLLPMAAQAEEVVVEGGSGDLLIGIAFTVSVLALTVVTLGVAYLSFMQWNDGRQEKKDQEEMSRGKISSPANAAGAKKGKGAKKESDRVRKRDKAGIGARSKGFSKRVRSELSIDEDE